MYSQLYDACVIPTMLYGAEVFGYIHPSNFEKIQKRALRFFMGVHNSTPIQAMMGDMGWTDIYIKEVLCMLRYWNRVIIMDNTRLERRIFMWDYNKGGDNWSNKISIILNSINCMHVYRNKIWCDIKEIENRLIDNYVTKWKSTIEKTPKLRTYIMFKDIFEPETYIIKCMSRRRRSLMSQFRTGILPLEIETGRYVPIFDKTLKKNRKRTANERICKLCRLNDIENEYHFLCVCPVYNSRRKLLFEEIELKHVHFHTLSLSDKFIFVMKHCQIEVSKFVNEAWSIRQTKL